jgi:hypothetical protein
LVIRFVVIVAVAVAVMQACAPRETRKDTMPKRDINAVMEDHTADLMRIPGVTGVAIGALDDGTPCILVLVLKETDSLKVRIPKTLEGYPVTIFESGEIKPMEGN